MATYVCLLNFTDQGIRNVKETTKRYSAAKGLAEKLGVKITNFVYTMGQYDGVAILEGNEEGINAFALATGIQGNVRTLTLRGITPDEMDRALAKI